ncbi:Jag family protein [Pedococcus sp. 2YAF34]|uniref:Jag family protein n=1 Tax=Pedococcus sp. 2YAF34 TaxID=3233032 RepID=UPI003F9E9A22
MTEQHHTAVDGDQIADAAPTSSEPTPAATDDTLVSETVDNTEEDAAATEPMGAETLDADAEDLDTDLATDGDEAGSDAPREGAARRRPAKTADLEREGEVAADFLETLLDIADLDGDIDVDVDGDRAAVSIVDSEEGRVPRRLVGQDGKVLDALQELTRLAVQSATGERSRLMLDVAGHRAERRASLVTIAQKAIADVRATGEKASLEPMTAFERKVVHDEVLAAGLSSESDGVEPRRFVVVLPA